MKCFFSILFFVFCAGFVFAQGTKAWTGFGIEANFSGGKILKHTEKFHAPVPAFTQSLELNFIQQTYGKKDWEQRRNYPLIGVGLSYTDYGLDSVFGKNISIYPNLEIPVIKAGKLEWTFRAGFGLAYSSRHYKRVPARDTLNNAIGSHFNNYTLFATDLRYRVNEHIDIQIGGNFSHVSNGALKQPNLGINVYGAHLGFRYFPVTGAPEKQRRKIPRLSNRWLLQIRAGIAGNEYGTTDGPLYPVYLLSSYASRRYAGKNKMFFGLDYSYHEGIYAFLKNNEIDPGREKQQSWKSAVFIGNEFLIGRMGILVQVGYYIKEAALKLDPYYEKLGCNFYIVQKEKGPVKEVSASILLKTHMTQAELAEFGIGIGL